MNNIAAPWTVGTPLITQWVLFNGHQGWDWFDNAAEHRKWRRDELHSAEVSFLRNRALCGCNSAWGVDWIGGFRFFRFDESLTFASLQNGCTWGQDGGIHEAYLNEHITNNLWGFQFGFNGDWTVAQGLRLFVTPKFGVYGNYIEQDFRLNLGDGTVAQVAAGGGPGTYPVHSDKAVLSFLTQIDLGVDWQFAQQWSARVGYRVLVATGMGLADHQIPTYLNDIPAIADIETNGQLILHGAFFGVTYNF